jgi:hypothetical protein
MSAITTKVQGLLLLIGRKDLEELPPVERRYLADLCRYVAEMADPRRPVSVPTSGVLVVAPLRKITPEEET